MSALLHRPSSRRSLGGYRGEERFGAGKWASKDPQETRAEMSPNRGNIRGAIALSVILIGGLYLMWGVA